MPLKTDGQTSRLLEVDIDAKRFIPNKANAARVMYTTPGTTAEFAVSIRTRLKELKGNV